MRENIEKYLNLLDLAKGKLEFFSVVELENFIKYGNKNGEDVSKVENDGIVPSTMLMVNDEFTNLKTYVQYRISINCKDSVEGCLISIFNEEDDLREMFIRITWSAQQIPKDVEQTRKYILTDEDIIAIKLIGARAYFIELFKIKPVLKDPNEDPLTIPGKDKCMGLEIGQNIKDEFISEFQKKFPDFSKLIDFEINRYGNILEISKIDSCFILDIITFYKKEEVFESDFILALNKFKATWNIDAKITLKSMCSDGVDRIFEIGDGDDPSAVKYNKVNDKFVAKIWFRWWDNNE